MVDHDAGHQRHTQTEPTGHSNMPIKQAAPRTGIADAGPIVEAGDQLRELMAGAVGSVVVPRGYQFPLGGAWPDFHSLMLSAPSGYAFQPQGSKFLFGSKPYGSIDICSRLLWRLSS